MLLICVAYAVFVGFQKLEATAFLREPDDQIVVEGEDAILHCVLSGPSTSIRKCFWSKDDKEVIVKHRYHFIAGTEALLDCSIRIKSVQSAIDHGNWKCGIKGSSSSNGVQSKVAKLNVIVVPDDPVILVNNETMMNGSTVVIDNIKRPPGISCISKSGYPAANLWWLLNKNYVDGNQHHKRFQYSKLTMNSAINSFWHEKPLHCVASHPSYGINQQRISYIRLLVKHDIQTVSAYTDQGLAINAEYLGDGMEVKLFCKADGYPPPSFYWERRANNSEPWQLFRIGQNVTFFPVNGQFSCIARQSNGLAVQSKEVITISGSHKIYTRTHIYVIFTAATGAVLIIVILLGTAVVLFQRNRRGRHGHDQHIVTRSTRTPYNSTCFRANSKPNESSLERILPNATIIQSNEPDYLTPIQMSLLIKSKEMNLSTELKKTSSYRYLEDADASEIRIYQEILPYDNVTYK